MSNEPLGRPALHIADQVLVSARELPIALTPMGLLKLVYISHGWMLGIHGRPLLSETVEAWTYGPVVPVIYQHVKEFGASEIPVDKVLWPGREPAFDNAESAVLSQTVGYYGRFSAMQLSEMTHEKGSPWAIVWNRHGRSAPIPNDLIRDHYARLYAQRSDAR